MTTPDEAPALHRIMAAADSYADAMRAAIDAFHAGGDTTAQDTAVDVARTWLETVAGDALSDEWSRGRDQGWQDFYDTDIAS
jgi:hypothetical protein